MWIGADEHQGGCAVGLGVRGARRGGVRGTEGERERRDGVVVLRAFGGVVWMGRLLAIVFRARAGVEWDGNGHSKDAGNGRPTSHD